MGQHSGGATFCLALSMTQAGGEVSTELSAIELNVSTDGVVSNSTMPSQLESEGGNVSKTNISNHELMNESMQHLQQKDASNKPNETIESDPASTKLPTEQSNTSTDTTTLPTSDESDQSLNLSPIQSIGGQKQEAELFSRTTQASPLQYLSESAYVADEAQAPVTHEHDAQSMGQHRSPAVSPRNNRRTTPPTARRSPLSPTMGHKHTSKDSFPPSLPKLIDGAWGYKLGTEIARCNSSSSIVAAQFCTPSSEDAELSGGESACSDDVAVKPIAVAIKRIPFEVAFESDSLDRIQAALRLARLCYHRNLWSFHTSFSNLTDSLWIVQPLYAGSIHDLLVSNSRRGFGEYASGCIVKGVMHGINYLHEQGVIHRSLSSRSIFIGFNNEIVVGRFQHAISYQFDGYDEYLHDYHSEPEHIPWAAPEYLRQDMMGYCEKVDIYSAGILAMELILGNQPYAGLLPTEILLLKLQDEEGPLSLVQSFYSPSSSLSSFLKQALDEDDFERSSAQALLSSSFLKQARKFPLAIATLAAERFAAITSQEMIPKGEQDNEKESTGVAIDLQKSPISAPLDMHTVIENRPIDDRFLRTVSKKPLQSLNFKGLRFEALEGKTVHLNEEENDDAVVNDILKQSGKGQWTVSSTHAAEADRSLDGEYDDSNRTVSARDEILSEIKVLSSILDELPPGERQSREQLTEDLDLLYRELAELDGLIQTKIVSEGGATEKVNVGDKFGVPAALPDVAEHSRTPDSACQSRDASAFD